MNTFPFLPLIARDTASFRHFLVVVVNWKLLSCICPILSDKNFTESFVSLRKLVYLAVYTQRNMKLKPLSFCDVAINRLASKAVNRVPYGCSYLNCLDVFFRYMNEEGWAPAVFLKRVGVATGNSPAILKRLSMTGMQLRDKAKDTEEILKTTVQDEECSRK